MAEKITVQTSVNLPAEKAWKFWNEPEHITKWAFASDDWHAPAADNDLRVGGRLKIRMESKDGSSGFDMEGAYTAVDPYKLIEYDMDGRLVRIEFIEDNGSTKISETFDAESENPIEMQRQGWQSIMDNYKKYAEKAISS